MDVAAFYPSKYMSAADLQGQPVRAVIESIGKELVGHGADAGAHSAAQDDRLHAPTPTGTIRRRRSSRTHR